MLEQYDDMLALYGTQTGVNLARKHIGWYTKGLPGSAELRNTRQPAGRSGGRGPDVAGFLFAVACPLRRLIQLIAPQVCF